MAEHEEKTPRSEYEKTDRQADENGCTYHSGRVEDWNYSSSQTGSSSSDFTGSYDAQGNSRRFGWQDGNPSGSGNQHNRPPEYGMNENGEYRYSYEDYNRISYDPNGSSARGRNGIKVFAIIVTVLLIVTTAVLLGVIVSSQQPLESQLLVTTETSSEVSESSSMQRPDQDEIEVPELNITSHAEEDTYISSDGKLTTTQIHEKVRPSVVGILNYSAENSLTANSSGSGIIISSDGYILTNAHVISGAVNLVVVLDNNEEYAAQLIGSDISTDLAVIKIDAENLTAAELGNSDQLKVGELVVAIGNPASLNLAGSTTRGIVSGLDRTISVTLETGESISMEVIQTDAAINPGNSGGPLINEYGQVIGINSSRLSSSSYDGIGFAIPVNNALPVVEDLIRYGYVTGRVKLGITYYSISEVVGAMSGYTPGLLVYSVDVTMDVYAKGLRAGDIITEMDGKPVTTKEMIKTILDGKKPGDTLHITFVRGSSDNQASYSVDVTLGEDTGNSDTSSYSSEPGTAEGVPTTADGTQSFT